MARTISLNRYRQIILSLPILTVFVSVLTIIIAYAVASDEKDNPSNVSNCTLHNNFPPYISDVGDCKPQSSVFTFGMTLSGCVSLLVFAIRFLQVRTFYTARDCENLASIITAVVLIIGKFIAVSFQLSSQKVIHYIGAGAYFLGTFIYVCLQARISYKHEKFLFILRSIIAFGLFSTGFLFAIFIIPSLEMKYIEWNISQVSEWCFAGLKMLFMLSFWFDFRDIVPVVDAKQVRNRQSYDDVHEFTYDNVSTDEVEKLEPKEFHGYNTAV